MKSRQQWRLHHPSMRLEQLLAEYGPTPPRFRNCATILTDGSTATAAGADASFIIPVKKTTKPTRPQPQNIKVAFLTALGFGLETRENA